MKRRHFVSETYSVIKLKIFIRYFTLFLIITISFLSSPLWAKDSHFRTQSNEDSIEPMISHGIDLLYSWEFNQAERLFNRIITLKPEDPIGYFYLSMVTWSKLASGFWSPEVVQQFLKRTEHTISIARRKIARDNTDSDAYFFLGGALGFKGRLQLMRHKWFSSYFLAAEAIEALKTCKEMDPDNMDVLYGLGTYEYYTAHLSGILKFLTYLFLYRGDKEEGLKKLHIAAENALYSSTEAKSQLLHVYLFLESDLHKARTMAKDLVEQFPNDPRYRFLLGVVHIRMDFYSDFSEVLDYLYARARNDNTLMSPIWKNRAIYLETVYHLYYGQLEQARTKLLKLLSSTNPALDPFMSAWPLVKIGMSYDLEGDREKAIECYNLVLSMENGAGAQFLAEKLIDKPPEKEDPFLGY